MSYESAARTHRQWTAPLELVTAVALQFRNTHFPLKRCEKGVEEWEGPNLRATGKNFLGKIFLLLFLFFLLLSPRSLSVVLNFDF